MKRYFCIFLTVLLLFSGCAFGKSKNNSAFYYLRSDLTYGAEDSVIAVEQRNVSGYENDLKYLLTLYLEGPLEDAYTSPFPKGTRITSIRQADGVLAIELSGEYASLTDLDLTMANACLAFTCFGLTHVQEVEITAAGESKVSVTLNRNSLTLLDTSAVTESPEK